MIAAVAATTLIDQKKTSPHFLCALPPFFTIIAIGATRNAVAPAAMWMVRRVEKMSIFLLFRFKVCRLHEPANLKPETLNLKPVTSIAYHPKTHPNINGATIEASDSTMNFGVLISSFPQVIFSFGTAPE